MIHLRTGCICPAKVECSIQIVGPAWRVKLVRRMAVVEPGLDLGTGKQTLTGGMIPCVTYHRSQPASCQINRCPALASRSTRTTCILPAIELIAADYQVSG